MPIDLSIGRDITKIAYGKAVKKAGALGMHDPGEDYVKRWAVALLDPTAHFTEKAIRAVLATDFSDTVAILVERCDRVSEHSGERTDSRGYTDRFCMLQDLMPAKARIRMIPDNIALSAIQGAKWGSSRESRMSKLWPEPARPSGKAV